MYCPQCRSEYRDGIVECAECKIALVAQLPPEEDPELTPVLRTTNQTLLTAFETALDASAIPFVVRGAEAASLMPLNAVVAVPREHLEAARELLAEAESGLDSMADDDS